MSDILILSKEIQSILNFEEAFNPNNKLNRLVKNFILPSSATLNKITEITNQYFADNNIYLRHLYPVIPKEHHLPPRGCNRNTRIVAYPFCHIYKLYINSLINLNYWDYSISSEYKYSDLKIEMEKYYISLITEKVIVLIFNLHPQNSNSIQRNNKCKDSNMKVLEIIATINLNNKLKKFHK